jgi:hypothetical protein
MRLGTLLHTTTLLLLASCQFNDTLPTTARVGCTDAASPCPGGYRCQLDQHVCVPATTAAKVTVARATLTPTRGNLATDFAVDLQVVGAVGSLTVTGAPLGDIAAAAPLAFACQTCTARGECRCVFHADPAAPPPDGKYTVTAQLADAFGDPVAPQTVDVLQLKTHPPQAPDVSATGIRYHRAPWGELPHPGTPTYRLERVGAAVAEDGKLVVYAQPGRQGPLGGFQVTAGQTAPLVLPGPDQERLYLDFVDNFGNQAEGGPFAVSVVDWVGTLGNKVKGSLTENPNTCFGRPAFEPVLAQRDDFEHELDAASGPTGNGQAVPGAPAWRQRRPSTPQTTLSTSAYDPVRDELVCAGCGTVTADQTWLFDRRDWRRVDGLSGWQPDRVCGQAAYDALSERVILFGGTDYGSNLADTWSWDGQRWTQAAPANAFDPAPAPADGGFPGGLRAQLAYSQRRQRVTLLDGNGEAWEWESSRWKQRDLGPDGGPTDGGRLPDSPTYWGSSVFQPLADGGEQWVLVALGALDDNDAHIAFDPYASNDTWTGVWTGTGYRWSLARPGTCAEDQPGCVGRRLAVDPVSHEVVQAATATLPDGGGGVQLWRWDGDPGHAWRPGPRLDGLSSLTGLFAQPARGADPARLVLLGSYAPDPVNAPYGVVNETYRCPAASDAGCERLHRAAVALPPQARAQAPLAFAPDGTGLLTGGLASPTGPVLGDVWRWDGNDWVEGPRGPRARYGSMLGWSGDALWLYGGVGDDPAAPLGDVWAYQQGAWAQLTPDAGGRAHCGTVSVPDGGGLFIAGDGLGLTRLGRTAGLELEDLGGAGDGVVGNLGYDANTSELLISGSVPADRSTFKIFDFDADAQAWNDLDIYMDNFTLRPVYDAAVKQLLVVGAGRLYFRGALDAYLYTAVAPQGTGQPIERYDQALAYDPLRQVTLMFGGSDLAGVPLADTWELSLAAERPATTCRFQFTPAAHGAQVQQVSIHAAAQAYSLLGAVPVELQVWNGDHFQQVSTCALDGGACSGLDYVSASPAEALALLSTGEELGVALLPTRTSAADMVTVRAVALQVEVTYLLP